MLYVTMDTHDESARTTPADVGFEARGLKGEGDRHSGTWVEADDLT